jgi:Bifunctional DNA primase/polymerase, N-terminal/Primase C terminal 1 (PriCT-1)
MGSLLENALCLASRGLHVFPCKPREKKPALWNGLKGATTDSNIIAGWWRTSDFNIGLATGERSGVFVVDIDGTDAEAELTKLESKHGALPRTVESKTARGRHLFFSYPHRGIRNSAGKIAPGIDVRGDGGYVLAPPSVHPSGKIYEWSVENAGAFAAAPNWLVSAAAKPSAANGAAVAVPATEWQELIKGAAEGTRDNTITRLAGYLLCRRVDPVMALALLQSWNATSCAPPLPDEDVARIVNSIAGKELRRRGGFGR